MNGILRDVIGFPTPTLQSCLIAHACFETAEVSRLRRTQGRLNPSSTWDISYSSCCEMMHQGNKQPCEKNNELCEMPTLQRKPNFAYQIGRALGLWALSPFCYSAPRG